MPYTPYTYTSPDDPGREDDGLFGAGSMTWRVMGNRIMWLAVVRALYLQALHPRVIRGTLQNAATITEPVDAWARLRRTRMFIETRLRGRAADKRGAHRRPRHDGARLDGRARRLLRTDQAEAVRVRRGEAGTLPGWARRMYGRPSGKLSDTAATAGVRAVRLAFRQRRLFRGAIRAIYRAELAAETQGS